MANEFERDNDLEKTRRISPYQELPQDKAEEYPEDGYDDEYEDADADEEYEEYDEYDEEEYDEQPGGLRGFLSTTIGKIFVVVIALLLVAVLALAVMKVFMKPGEPVRLPSSNTAAPVVVVTKEPAAQATSAPGAIVFAPKATEKPEATQAPTQEPTQAPTQKPTAAPTEKPEPTATPLPIVLTNTATPSPTPTPTATPTATPTPSPTPTVAPTAVPEIAKGEVNRDANLREAAASNGKVKQLVKKGEAVTIHEAVLDKDSKVWYGLTVDDQEVSGWMRDYVVDSKDKIASPTHTPKPTATPAPEKVEEEKPEAEKATAEPTATPNPDAIGAGTTKKEANVRKVMNGKVLVQLRKGKRVDILGVKMDKKGEIWYEVKAQGSSTVGFVRDYLIELDDGVELVMPTATPAPEATPVPERATAEPTAAPEEPAEEKKEESVLDREIIGKGVTKRAANIRVKPAASGKLVRQLSKGNALMILEKYQDEEGNIWYEVSTESGKTYGFVRDYLLEKVEIDEAREAKIYEESEADANAEEESKKTNSKWKYAGNKKSLVFHDLSCDSLSSGSDFLVYFESKDYAVNKGYRPCGNCNP